MQRLEAGRELDALVAEKVMGWSGVEWRGFEYAVGIHPVTGMVQGVYRYSTDITDAWQIVERLTRDGRAVFIDSAGFDPEEWRVIVSVDDPEGQLPSEAATAPLAICLAALETVEVMERDHVSH